MDIDREEMRKPPIGGIIWAVVITFIFASFRAFINAVSISGVAATNPLNFLYPPAIIAYIFVESAIMIYLAILLVLHKRLLTCQLLIFYYIGSRIALLIILYNLGFNIESGLGADVIIMILYTLLMIPGLDGASNYGKLIHGAAQSLESLETQNEPAETKPVTFSPDR